MRCPMCGSYNTKIIEEQIKKEEYEYTLVGTMCNDCEVDFATPEQTRINKENVIAARKKETSGA